MRRLSAALTIALLGFALVAALRPTGAVERLELLTLDARYELGLGRRAPGDDIVVAWIDQESMDYVDQPFPWPREVFAQVLAHLEECGARAVVFDVLFDQRDIADDDRGFGEALAQTRGDVLAMKFVEHREGGRDDAETQAFLQRGLDVPELERARERGIVLPFEELAAGADQLGFVNIRPDEDKVFRRYDLLRAWGPPGEAARAYPSLALAASLALGKEFDFYPDGDLVLFDALAVRDDSARPTPTDPDGRMLLNFRGEEFTFPHVKFVNIFESINRIEAGEAPLYPPELFKDKIVLVGINAEGYEDVHPTPLSERFPGVELHATALDNLLRADAIRAPRHELVLAAGAAVLATAAVFAFSGVVAPLLALLVLLAGGLAAAALAWLGLVAVPLAAPGLAGGTSASLAFLYRLVVEGKQKRALQRAFRSYLAPEVLREVLRDPDAVRLGGEVREVTLFFTDLAGFTGLAEHTRPAELVAFLNDYFTRMCQPILAERGVIDKFIGDAIMAFFGAPIVSRDHGGAAVRAALAALEVSARIAAELAARGLPPIQTRIGIHAGPAVIGNMGSAERFDYTAIGDTVNLASRLEGANKAFGTRCLVSETAWAMTGEEVLGREVGRIGVVGRAAPIRVFEPLALRAQATAEELSLATQWQAAVCALQAGDRAACRAALEAVLSLRPADGLTRLYLERLAEPGFDGVFRLDGK